MTRRTWMIAVTVVLNEVRGVVVTYPLWVAFFRHFFGGHHS